MRSRSDREVSVRTVSRHGVVDGTGHECRGSTRARPTGPTVTPEKVLSGATVTTSTCTGPSSASCPTSTRARGEEGPDVFVPPHRSPTVRSRGGNSGLWLTTYPIPHVTVKESYSYLVSPSDYFILRPETILRHPRTVCRPRTVYKRLELRLDLT